MRIRVSEADVLNMSEKDQDLEDGLSLELHESYYHAIIEDNVNDVTELFRTCTSRDITRMINTRFLLPDSKKRQGRLCRNTSRKQLTVELPLSLAAAAGSLATVNCFLDNDVDVMKNDVNGNNAIHVLILTSESFPEMEERMLTQAKQRKTMRNAVRD